MDPVPWPRLRLLAAGELGAPCPALPEALDPLRPGACELRPSAAPIAALYPRIACSLDMTPLVRGFSARSARKPATASENLPHVDADERALLCPGRVFFTALHEFLEERP